MRITFVPLSREDFPLLASWLALPHVRAWWLDPEPTVASVEAGYGDVVDGHDPAYVCLIRLDGSPIGLIQAFRHADEPEVTRMVGMPDAAGIDYLIGPAEHRGRGVGSAAIRDFTAHVLDRWPEVTGIVAVPLARNHASRRALEKSGFHLLDLRELDSPDPSDAGVNAVYHLPRPS